MAAALGMAMRREPEGGGLGPPSFFVDRPTKCSKLAPVRRTPPPSLAHCRRARRCSWTAWHGLPRETVRSASVNHKDRYGLLPAPAGKSQATRELMVERTEPTVLIEFQSIYAGLLAIDRLS